MNTSIDLNKFRSFVPISSLFDENIVYLAERSQVKVFAKGEQIFVIGEMDNYSLFLLSGEVLLKALDDQTTTICSGTEKATYAMANLKPRCFNGYANQDDTTVVIVDTSLIDKMMAWSQIVPGCGSGMEVIELDGPDAKDSSWMMSMLLTPTFLKLPPANIERVFEKLEEKKYAKGALVFKQGEMGDFYYTIKEGSCEVIRTIDDRHIRLATLKVTESFGEEALMSDVPRNASIRMLSDGILMRLHKKDFLPLMQEPQLKWIDLKEMEYLVKNKGAVQIDVRLENEFKNSSHKKGVINIPLYLLRLKLKRLNKKRRYIVYCDTGERSSAAAFLMSEEGFKVYVLKGGLVDCK